LIGTASFVPLAATSQGRSAGTGTTVREDDIDGCGPLGLDGSLTFVDLENGVLLSHEDFVDAAGAVRVTTLATGSASQSMNDLDHSTAVLGVVLATDNAKGIVGITPNVRGFAAPAFPGTPVDLDAALLIMRPVAAERRGTHCHEHLLQRGRSVRAGVADGGGQVEVLLLYLSRRRPHTGPVDAAVAKVGEDAVEHRRVASAAAVKELQRLTDRVKPPQLQLTDVAFEDVLVRVRPAPDRDAERAHPSARGRGRPAGLRRPGRRP
jgi:hypothetical protein